MASVTRLKRRLGLFLRELRERAGKTAVEAGVELKQDSSGMISRYESGAVLPPWSTVRILLAFYGATAEELARASRLYDDAKVEPRSVRLTPGASRAFRTLVNAEREAVRERDLSLSVVPGLLQTEGYARALVEAGQVLHRPDMRRDSIIATRMNRQIPLEDPDPMVLHTLIDEAAIRRVVGGPEVFGEQLAHLLEMTKRPNITVQVIPFEVGAYSTMNGSVVIIVDYPEPDATPGVYLGYPAGGAWVDDEDDVKRFTTMFDQVTRLALNPADTNNLIDNRLRSLGRRESNGG